MAADSMKQYIQPVLGVITGLGVRSLLRRTPKPVITPKYQDMLKIQPLF